MAIDAEASLRIFDKDGIRLSDIVLMRTERKLRAPVASFFSRRCPNTIALLSRRFIAARALRSRFNNYHNRDRVIDQRGILFSAIVVMERDLLLFRWNEKRDASHCEAYRQTATRKKVFVTP
jgi:hypothetical protein